MENKKFKLSADAQRLLQYKLNLDVMYSDLQAVTAQYGAEGDAKELEAAILSPICTVQKAIGCLLLTVIDHNLDVADNVQGEEVTV